jgi:N-acetyl-anhydromuramyl-L-alanine amidase AmpD
LQGAACRERDAKHEDTMGVSAPTGGAHKVLARMVIKVNVAVHLSLHRTGEAAPDPAALADGVVDRKQRRMIPPRKIRGAIVSIDGTTVSATTDANGNCDLVVSGLADGDFSITITPDPKQDASTMLAAGAPLVRGVQPSPAFLDVPDGSDFAYRGTTVSMTLAAGKLKTHPFVKNAKDLHARVMKGAKGTSFELDIKPDWVRDDDASKRSKPLEMIVVHHTGSTSTVGDMAEFISSEKSIHYLLDIDGHVIKMVNNDKAAGHAGRSRWRDEDGLGARSIGIEITHAATTDPETKKPREYSPEQITTVRELVDQLLTRLSIPRNHVVGHEDIGTGDDNKPDSVLPLTQVGRKATDPGNRFPWKELEGLGIGLQLTGPEPDTKTMYNGVFATAKVMPRAKGAHVVELRVDLDLIGYSLNNITSNVYDAHVSAAVTAFQRHFTTLDRRTTDPGAADDPPLRFGNVDIRTAREIKRCTRWD